MLSVDEGEEIFFDTADHLMSDEESVFVKANLNYDIWLREPQSVKHRREEFFIKMGFLECSTLTDSQNMGLDSEVITGCDGQSIHDSYDENLLSERRRSNSEANCSVDYSDQDWLDDICIATDTEYLSRKKQCEIEQVLQVTNKKNKKVTRWWKQFTQAMKKKASGERKLVDEGGTITRMKVEQNRKRCMECSAVYSGQQIKAHKGLIWSMRFSPDGQYLASGGEDGLVCIWRVSSVDASSKAEKCCFGSQDMMGNELSPSKKNSGHASIIIPERIFHIEEEPLHKFHGHSSDVLDLAWSTSNHLLSSSMDKTVRLWRVGSDKCLAVFHHSNYVTCVQFNPVDENYFISGSIDGKVRIWGIPKRRVEYWANVGDIVTAICYQPNGKCFLVGTFSGTCRFYELSDDELLLSADINISGRKKSSSNKITGIQFLKNDSQRVMLTSEDSKIRILDGLEVVCKYKGLTNSGSQMSASFTSSGRHIVSVGEDSHIYLWNYDNLSIQASKQAKTINSCEHFLFEGVSVVLPWSEMDLRQNNLAYDNSRSNSPTHNGLEASYRVWDSERFSLANWFSMEGSYRATMTWPEEKLPIWDNQPCTDHMNLSNSSSRLLPSTWGLVFVTANADGTIKTFHNYGLPVKS